MSEVVGGFGDGGGLGGLDEGSGLDSARPTTEARLTTSVFGVRHHGPGSARAVIAGLEALQPDAVLIEGPSDADGLVPLVGADGMTPPVALLAYAADSPQTSAFWPFAVFSPEWQALSWAVQRGISVRFCDLPSWALLGKGEDLDSARSTTEEEQRDLDSARSTTGDFDSARSAEGEEERDLDSARSTTDVRRDPLGMLSEAAGYDDPERWWDDVIESRFDGEPPFEAITEAMAEIRESLPPQAAKEQLREDQREAHMRQVIRQTLKDGAQRIAVICGAWHAPALAGKLPPATADAKLLKGLPKRKMNVTWVPWTHSRLSYHSGYGAGISSPGWYAHLFQAPDRPIARWMTKAARELREHDYPVSSAHVIEGVRLAETLAAVRDRQLPGLAEVTEATLAVLCEGDEVALNLVHTDLVVGEALGEVPDETPSVPLQLDLNALTKTLRLKPEPLEKTVVLDLRKDNDRHKSQLLHRLNILQIPWGRPDNDASKGSGTFKEGWALRWHPEFAVDVIEASMWGTTVESAATATLIDKTTKAADLASITRAVEQALLADLSEALQPILNSLSIKAALDHDVLALMSAIPPLIRAAQYGDVRGTDAGNLIHVVDTLLLRVCVGLPAAVGGLNDEGAADLKTAIDNLHAAINLRGTAENAQASRNLWFDTLTNLADRKDMHGLLAGRIVRILLDAKTIETEAAGTRLHRALSYGSTAAEKASWVEGFLAGDGLLLVHNTNLLAILDTWVSELSDEDFTDAVVLLRRSFGTFAAPERRTVGEQVRRLNGTAVQAESQEVTYDVERARPALKTVATLLGIK